MIERQELYCHNCNKYVQFNLDLSLNGNHILNCPNCGHEHCRVVRNGKITGDRWDSRNFDIPIYTVTNITCTATSTWNTYCDSGTTNSTSTFLYGAWMNLTTGT